MNTLAGWQRFALTIAACAATTLIATPLLAYLDLANIVMLFLLTVLLVSVSLGMGPALLAAFVSVGMFDFFFVPPRFSFEVHDGQYLVTFVVMLTVAIITGQLTAGLRRQAAESEVEALRTSGLYDMARDLSGALMVEQVVDITQNFLRKVFGAEASILMPDAKGLLQACPEQAAVHFLIEPRLATIAFERGQLIESGGLEDSGYASIYLPLKAPMRMRGVVAVSPSKGSAGTLFSQKQRLETMASLVAIALERVHYVDVAQRSQVQMVSERLRSSILSAISHDLRTPLTALVGLADSLTVSKPPLGEPARETAEAIREQAERLASQVGNLLDMARLHAGEVTLNREWQPIEEVIGSSIKLLGRALAAHPVKVSLAKDLPLINLDAVLIERVFCNLLENAAKYSPLDSANSSANNSAIEIRGKTENQQLLVSVCDSGQGFTQAENAAVFEMFVRGESESTLPGVGLGLAICRAIVEAHDGTISIANRPEGGACVTFALPLGNPPSIEEEIIPQEDECQP